jgi:hypothetical protein
MRSINGGGGQGTPTKVRARRKPPAGKPVVRRAVRSPGLGQTRDAPTISYHVHETEPVHRAGRTVGHRKVTYRFASIAAADAHLQRRRDADRAREQAAAQLLAAGHLHGDDPAHRIIDTRGLNPRVAATLLDGRSDRHLFDLLTPRQQMRVRGDVRSDQRAQRAVDDLDIHQYGIAENADPTEYQHRRDEAEHAKAEADRQRVNEEIRRKIVGAELTIKPEHHSLTGLAANALKNAKDAVVGLPGTAKATVDLAGDVGTVTGDELAGLLHLPRGKHNRADAAKARAHLKAAGTQISEHDPLYHTGQAVVRAAKGDLTGAKSSLQHAAEDAYQRPLDAALYAKGAATTLSKGASIIKEGGREAHRAAQLRPDKVVREPGDQPVASRAELDAARDNARAGHVDDVDRVRVSQRYKPGLVGRTIQKARENRAAAKGRDPLALTGRKARKARKRSFDRASRNAHAGGLAREELAAAALKHKLNEHQAAAADLLATGHVRTNTLLEDLRGLYRTAKAQNTPEGARNAAIYEHLGKHPELFAHKKVKAAAADLRAELQRSEAALHAEGYFPADTDPEFVRRVQGPIARGEVIQVKAGDRLPAREHAPEPEPRPEPTPEGPATPPTEPDDVAALHEAIAGHQEALSKVDDELRAVQGEIRKRTTSRTVKDRQTGRTGRVRQPVDEQAARELGPLRTRERQLADRRAALRTKIDAMRAQAGARTGRPEPRDRAAARPLTNQELARKAAADARNGIQVDHEALAQGRATVDVEHAPKPAARVEVDGGRPAPRRGRDQDVRTAIHDGYVHAHGPKAGDYVNKHELPDDGVFVRGVEPQRGGSRDFRIPEAGHGYSATDALRFQPGTGRTKGTVLDRERQITLARLAKNVEQRFAHKQGTTGRFDAADGQRIAQQLSSKGDEWTTMDVAGHDGQVLVVPKVIAARWRAQFAEPSRVERAGRLITRQFVRTVLPWSATWHAGNALDLFTRLALTLTPADLTQGRAILAHLDKAMADLDPALRHELMAPLTGHFGSRQTVRTPRFNDLTHDAKHQFVRDLGDAVTALRQKPGIRHVGDPIAALTDKAFDIGSDIEQRFVHLAAGKAARDTARALGLQIEDHMRAGAELARRFADDPQAMEDFQARTLELVGDYVTKGPGERAFINTLEPFWKWVKAANTFVYRTLPAKSPMRTAFMLWAASVTEPEREKMGLSAYITPEQAKKLHLPKPRMTGFSAGSLPMGNGFAFPTTPFTSFGEAAKVFDLAAEAQGRGPGWATRPIARLIKGDREGAAGAAVEAFVPGAKNARMVRQVRRRATFKKGASTLLDPKNRDRPVGNSATTAAAVGFVQPIDLTRDDPELGKTPPQAGAQVTLTHRMPDGSIKVVRLRRKLPLSPRRP